MIKLQKHIPKPGIPSGVGLTLLLCMIFCGMSYGQDLREDLNKSYSAYADLKDFATDIKVDIYRDEGYTKPYITLAGHIQKSGNRYMSHFEKNTILINDKYMVFVDEEGKYLYYKDLKTVKDKEKAFENPYDPAALRKSLDSALAHCDSIHYNGAINGANEYYVKSRKLIYLMTLDIDIETHLIKKLVYYYNKKIMKENNKVSIEFLNATTKPVFTEDMFSERKYISIDGNRIAPAGKYAAYDIVNDEPQLKR